MPVITDHKSFHEIHSNLLNRGDLSIVVIGCEDGASGCRTGGSKEIREIRDRIKASNLMLLEPEGIYDAVKEGLCNKTAVMNLLPSLRKYNVEYQLLLLCCGAGLKTMMDILPDVRIVPVVNTLGVGPEDQLSCLCCGDCHFDDLGCHIRQVKKPQVDRLNDCYEKG
jgi:hypothetical protein